MTKPPSPKADALRAMREAQFAEELKSRRVVIVRPKALREAVAAIPAKKVRKPKVRG